MNNNEREEFILMIYELFEQGCLMPDGMFNHHYIGIYEHTQKFLIDEGKIKQGQCIYPS